MIPGNALRFGKQQSNEGRVVASMSLRETKISNFNSIENVLVAICIVTVGVVKEMHYGINVSVERKRMTSGRQDIGL